MYKDFEDYLPDYFDEEHYNFDSINSSETYNDYGYGWLEVSDDYDNYEDYEDYYNDRWE